MLGGGDHDSSGGADGSDALNEANLLFFRWQYRTSETAATAEFMPGVQEQINCLCAGALSQRPLLGAGAVDASPLFLSLVVGSVASSTYVEGRPVHTRNDRTVRWPK